MRTQRQSSSLLALTLAAGCALGCGTDDIVNEGELTEGALISTTMDGRVGYLLDELPQGLRERVAQQLISQPESIWQERARAQARLMTYRLVFRNFFYAEEEAKGQLPLPPEEKWQITLLAAPERATVDGHDLVLIDYRLQSTLLTDGESPAAADQALGAIGGTWTEPFVLPLDPELLLQRTGFACMDESEFPPNSVDGENVATFYDQDCEAGENECHVSETPDEDCTAALTRAVGSLSTELRFERLPWDATLADSVRVGAIAESGSDLQVIGDGLDNHRIIYRYIAADSCAMAENCVTGLGWRRLLQFDASVKNVGADALHIGDVDYYLEDQDTLLSSHNIFVYSECHEHYHFAHYGSFELGTENQRVGNKQAFCLQSTNRYGNNETAPLTHDYSSCEYQGIQAGWGDDYGAGVECQWVDVTGMADSGPLTARLAFQSNPDRFLCEGQPVLDDAGEPVFEDSGFRTETNQRVDRPSCDFSAGWDSNNLESRSIPMPQTGGFITEPCTRGQLGPLRDCGFRAGVAVNQSLELQLADVVCPVGSSIQLRCSVPDGTPPAVLRACEYSESLGTGVACVYRDAIANQLIEGSDVLVDITCPEARDAIEVGGRVALYGAPVVPGDVTSLSCSPL